MNKLFIKILFTTLAFWYIFSKVGFDEVVELIKSANPLHLSLAFLSFNISKIISSIRLNILFKLLNIILNEFEALKLYYIGMFYNLFLPGGVGGDGYKIYLLKKHNNSSITETLKGYTY